MNRDLEITKLLICAAVFYRYFGSTASSEFSVLCFNLASSILSIIATFFLFTVLYNFIK